MYTQHHPWARLSAITKAFVVPISFLLSSHAAFGEEPSEKWTSLVSITAYESIQSAIEANPNQVLFVPPGDYPISKKIALRSDRSGLVGPGRIIQTNPSEPAIEVEGAEDVQLKGITLSRPENSADTRNEAILAIRCKGLSIDHVKSVDNRSRSAAFSIRGCDATSIRNCTILNYMTLSVDDRTQDPHWGYAFHCTDGTGIAVQSSTATRIESNIVREERLVPTKELQSKHSLGKWIRKTPERGSLVAPATWESEYSENWQQGSAILVTSPTETKRTILSNNVIENGAQGIDLHSDQVIVVNNIVSNCFIGMKAMHGSRNVLIQGNQFIQNTLWSIGLMPGVSSSLENQDGGSIVANNIISDFGQGDASWIWGNRRSPFKFDRGQETEDPPLRQVQISGNIISNTGPASYRFAVIIEDGSNAPTDIHFSNNLFPPGTDGVSNTPLAP